MATSDQQWQANVNQAEADALASKSIAQDNNVVGKDVLEANLKTGQGASDTYNLSYNSRKFNIPAPATHGTLYETPNIEINQQALNVVLPIQQTQQRADVGWMPEQSANERGGYAMPVVTSDLKSQYAIPTAPVAKNTGGEWQNNGADNFIPSVASRFIR